MIRCLVIDDEPFARQLLSDFIKKVPDLYLEGSFSSALKSLEILRRKQIDVLFLDIQMPDISGIEFLKTLDNKPLVIFTTAHAEHALQGFELDVADYLLKPFDFNRFLKSVNKISQRVQAFPRTIVEPAAEKKDFIFIKDGTKLIKIQLNSIRYIKGLREYVTIFTYDKKIMSLQVLKSLEEMLPSKFIRIHNSYIIAFSAIDAVIKNKVQIGLEFIPIGITYKKRFFEELQRYYPGKSPVSA